MFEKQLKKTKLQLCEDLFHSGHKRAEEQASIRVFAKSLDTSLNDITDSLSLLLKDHEKENYDNLEFFAMLCLSRIGDVRKSIDKLHPDKDYKSKYNHPSAKVRAETEELMKRS